MEDENEPIETVEKEEEPQVSAKSVDMETFPDSQPLDSEVVESLVQSPELKEAVESQPLVDGVPPESITNELVCMSDRIGGIKAEIGDGLELKELFGLKKCLKEWMNEIDDVIERKVLTQE